MINEEQCAQLKLLAEDPKDRSNVYHSNNVYWDWLSEIIHSEVEGSSKLDLILDEYKKAINFGVLDESIVENSNTLATVTELCDSFDDLQEKQYYFIDWLIRKFNEILLFKEVETTEDTICTLNEKCEKLDVLIQKFQDDRAAIVMAKSRKPDPQKVDLLNNRDDALLKSAIRKTGIANGHNMSPEERRSHLAEEERLSNLIIDSESIQSEIEDDDALNRVKLFTKNIELSIEKVLETRNLLSSNEEQLEKYEEQVNNISIGELQNRMNEEIKYFKGLMKLSANRVKAEAISVLHGNTQVVTFDVVNELLILLEEFDSKLYQNNKVAYIGKPSIVLIPGKGNGMYDWKNNALIIPTMPYTTPILSVIKAIVEYRIDMDEDKSLFNGFTEIKGNESIKSTMDFRAKFTKEYITWMTKEYNGYKVMTKEVRYWFEHEIGPNKQYIIIPARYVIPPMSSKDYLEKIRLLDEQIKSQGDNSNPDVLYERAIAYCSEDAWHAAKDIFLALHERIPHDASVVYNLGFLHAKTKEYRVAVEYFNTFIRLNPSSWWAGIAKDNIMKLR